MKTIIYQKFFRQCIFLTLMIVALSFGRVECREFVFVINSGAAMNTSDPNHAIPDVVMWGAANLNADDELAIIAFDNAPRVIRPLTKLNDNPVESFMLAYGGHSNAGAALLNALDILSPKFNTERYIIFFTDGENLLDSAVYTMQTVENFQAGLRQAKWLGIPVYIFSLRAGLNPNNYHTYDGAREIPMNYADLMTNVRTVFYNDFNVAHMEIFKKTVSSENVSLDVPVESNEPVKLMLIASHSGNVAISGATTKFNGRFVKIFEVTPPTKKILELQLNYPSGTGVTVDAIAQVRGNVSADVDSSILEGTTLNLTPFYADNPEDKIFDDEYFQGKFVRTLINGETISGQIVDGAIKIPTDEEELRIAKVYFEDAGINFVGDDTAQVNVPQNHFAIWIAALGAIGLILFLSWRIQSRNYLFTNLQENTQQPEKTLPPVDKFFSRVRWKNNSYQGKFLIYVTKSADNKEYSPREFNLFRVTDAQINLTNILKACKLDEIFQNVSGIVFTPKQQGLTIKNNSECSVIRRNEFVERGKSADLLYNDTVNIFTADESAELILVYKSLKPLG